MSLKYQKNDQVYKTTKLLNTFLPLRSPLYKKPSFNNQKKVDKNIFFVHKELFFYFNPIFNK